MHLYRKMRISPDRKRICRFSRCPNLRLSLNCARDRLTKFIRYIGEYIFLEHHLCESNSRDHKIERRAGHPVGIQRSVVGSRHADPMRGKSCSDIACHWKFISFSNRRQIVSWETWLFWLLSPRIQAACISCERQNRKWTCQIVRMPTQ